MTDQPIWYLRLICCERDDGVEVFNSWKRADRFRESYTSGPGVNTTHNQFAGGHRRVAILQKVGGVR